MNDIVLYKVLIQTDSRKDHIEISRSKISMINCHQTPIAMNPFEECFLTVRIFLWSCELSVLLHSTVMKMLNRASRRGRTALFLANTKEDKEH